MLSERERQGLLKEAETHLEQMAQEMKAGEAYITQYLGENVVGIIEVLTIEGEFSSAETLAKTWSAVDTRHRRLDRAA